MLALGFERMPDFMRIDFAGAEVQGCGLPMHIGANELQESLIEATSCFERMHGETKWSI